MKNGEVSNLSCFGTAPVLERPSVALTHAFQANLNTYTTDKGTHVIEGLRVFKTGTFTDMFGREASWEDIHLDQMIAHFHLLRDGGYLVDVPVRADHSFSVKDVVGYYMDIYRDADDPSFLSATIEITEDDAWEKWDRGTWRARSIEIGEYRTNDGKTFWPVVQGLAFVDIGAVEGLHSRPNSSLHFHQVVTDMEETSMQVPDITKDPEGWTKAVNYAAWLQAAQYAQACTDWERAVNYAHALEQEANTNGGTPTNEGGQPAITGQPPASHAAGNANGGNLPTPPQVMTFRVNGQPTADFRTVQAHIDVLEQYRQEATESNRREFVRQLATDNKIAATQVESLTNHALSLSDEQFSSFRQTYENAPALTVFGNHGNTGDGAGGQPPRNSGGEVQPDELETAKEIVNQFRLSGMDQERIKSTPSYKKLVAAGIEPA